MIVPTRGVYAKRWISRLNEKLITLLDSETLLSIYRFFVSFSAGYSYRLMKRRNVVYLKLINSRILADIIRKLDTRGLSIDFFFSIVVKFVQLCFEHLQSMGGLILLYRRQGSVRLTKSDKYSFVFLFGSLRIFFLRFKKKKHFDSSLDHSVFFRTWFNLTFIVKDKLPERANDFLFRFGELSRVPYLHVSNPLKPKRWNGNEMKRRHPGE